MSSKGGGEAAATIECAPAPAAPCPAPVAPTAAEAALAAPPSTLRAAATRATRNQKRTGAGQPSHLPSGIAAFPLGPAWPPHGASCTRNSRTRHSSPSPFARR
eukprot:scaffold29451_cov73-Isochrysis_galbana.AAC.1